MAGCLLVLGTGHAQVTFEGNNSFNSATDFVGWDNTVTNDPLMIKHEANQPIEWYTFDIPRMRLNPNQTSTLNGIYTGVVQNGFVGISDQPLFFGGPGPFSRLHLVDRGTGSGSAAHYAQQLGYRPWQRNGVTFTGNAQPDSRS